MSEPTVEDPVERLVPGIEAELRAFVAAAGSRRALPVTAYAGVPSGHRAVFAATEVADAGLRADLVGRALDGLDGTEPACAWLARPGELVPGDEDVAWLAAARAGFERHGLVLPAYFLLNRYGWRELLGGRERAWHRVRPQRRVGGP